MNSFIEAQCRNMLSVLATFQNSCELAAKQDDGVIDGREASDLRQINAAVNRFAGELKCILGDADASKEQPEKPNRRKWHGLF